jgi:hypothetical protein
MPPALSRERMNQKDKQEATDELMSGPEVEEHEVLAGAPARIAAEDARCMPTRARTGLPAQSSRGRRGLADYFQSSCASLRHTAKASFAVDAPRSAILPNTGCPQWKRRSTRSRTVLSK